MDQIVDTLRSIQDDLNAKMYEHAAAAIDNALTFIASQRLREQQEKDATAHAEANGSAPDITVEQEA